MTSTGSSERGVKRVLLHVGTPKTGTSYLQDVLFRNRELLREHGILYPADRFDGHFLAALDLMRLTWGGIETQAVGAWDRLADEVRRWPQTSIISHEILSTASPTQIDRAMTSFGDDVEVHLIVSVRDLVRQVPAEWQENVKHRSLVSYAHFLDMIRDPSRDTRIGSWFWGAQEIPDILDRWGAILPAHQVHVVTVPRPGAAPDELWRRFSRTFGLDGIDLDLTPERANPSLGVPETALLRLINKRVTVVVDPPDYRPLVRELLAHQTLSRRTRSARLGLPPATHEWVQELSRTWVEEIEKRGYDVVGDVADVLGQPLESFTDPDTAPASDLLPAALDVIRALLVEGSRLRESEARLSRELDGTRAELELARRSPAEKTVQAMETRRSGRVALGAYRWLRRR
ncbi:MAG: hypothetical protein AVDCRST_MAG60-148 [uncultured Nocardioides sp.]|uniref:Sulfotransferase domain-containing protein n=1 Tax=uncultured Nocardioides sp. TaxID=198441 RepID=A0A6J4MXR6_9ACTN|nr:MAG: hypothetical protein AVDCRST_MAG60-148 [uncultured Nocardioides sp.]